MIWYPVVEGRATIGVGDCRELLRALPDASVDACVCDPPYEIGFMGRDWDATGVAYDESTWRAVYRVLKPGAPLLAFGGSRSWPEMAVAIRHAGFERRDELDWIYATGFPKNDNLGRAVDMRLCTLPGRHYETTLPRPDKRRDGDHLCPRHPAGDPWREWGNALTPAREPIVLAVKPREGSFADNLLAHGVGGLHVDACRVGAETTYTARRGHSGDHGIYGGDARAGVRYHDVPGRFPKNVLFTHASGCEQIGERTEQVAQNVAPEGTLHSAGWGTRKMRTSDIEVSTPVYRCVEGCPVLELDRQSGGSKSRRGKPRASAEPGDGWGMTATGAEYDDAGGASRFFPCFCYVAKPSARERDLGLEDLPERSGGDLTDREDGSAGLDSPRAGAGRRGGRKNNHTTVKPLELMRWLVRLVTPPGGLVLDPFAGSGTTGMAALEEGFRFVGCELSPEYAALAARRIQACWRG